MPAIMWVGPYRFYFYAGEGNEPPHIHVDRDNAKLKFWLDPVRLAKSSGFKAHEITEISHIIVEHKRELLEAWNRWFGARSS